MYGWRWPISNKIKFSYVHIVSNYKPYIIYFMHLSNTNDISDNDHKYLYVIPPSTCLNHSINPSLVHQETTCCMTMTNANHGLVFGNLTAYIWSLSTCHHPKKTLPTDASCLIICNQSSSLSFRRGNKNLERVVATRSTELHESWVIQTHWWRLEVHLNKLGGWRRW